jgi:hypothetical protein
MWEPPEREKSPFGEWLPSSNSYKPDRRVLSFHKAESQNLQESYS